MRGGSGGIFQETRPRARLSDFQTEIEVHCTYTSGQETRYHLIGIWTNSQSFRTSIIMVFCWDMLDYLALQLVRCNSVFVQHVKPAMMPTSDLNTTTFRPISSSILSQDDSN